jgi:hypothetical protein
VTLDASMSLFTKTEHDKDQKLDLFVKAMRTELEKNGHKGSWEERTVGEAYAELIYHAGKLGQALASDSADVLELCVDVANEALILADVSQELTKPDVKRLRQRSYSY